ncbi:hypothetical protein [Pseudoalteromonas sp. GB56]
MRLNQDFAQAQLLMLQNERRTRDMFTKIKELGELQTMEYVVQEAYVLSAESQL